MLWLIISATIISVTAFHIPNEVLAEEAAPEDVKEIDFDSVPGLYNENGELNSEVLDSLLDEGLFDIDDDIEYQEEDKPTPVLATSPRETPEVISSSLEEDYADELAFRMKKREQKMMKKPDAFINLLNSIGDIIYGIVSFLRDTDLGNIVLVLIIITIISLVVYLFKKNKAKVARKADDEVPPEEMTDEELIRKADLGELLVSAEQGGKLKSAYRYRYLILIKTLHQYDIINWSPALTNDSIRRQIKDKSLADEFRKLTTAYEYLWFGGYPIDQQEYDRLKSLTSKSTDKVEAGVNA